MRDKANNSTFHVDYSAPKRHGCISKERCVGLSDIRKACAANASPAATTPVLLANPLTTRCVASTTIDRKSTRLNSSHTVISYAVFCLKKKKTKTQNET